MHQHALRQLMPDWRSGPGVSHNQKVLPPSNTLLSSFLPVFHNNFSSTLWYYTNIAVSFCWPQVIIDFAQVETFQYIFPPSCTYSPLTTLWVKHRPKCRPVNCGSWGSSSDICCDIVHEHNVFSLKWNTELSTCKREELMISTYYYLNKPFMDIFTSQSESVFSCSRPPGRIFSPFPLPCSISLQLWQEPGKGK